MVVFAFCVAFGDRVEWSLAWPGIGIALDCWALLISDLLAGAVAAVSRVGPDGSTPITFDRGSISAAVVGTAVTLGVLKFLSLQPSIETAATSATHHVAWRMGLMRIVISCWD